MSSALCEKTKSYVPGIVVTLGKCHESHSKERKDKNNDKYFHTRVLFLLEPSQQRWNLSIPSVPAGV